ncbi:MAG: energy transducer TonB [Prevotella sp.]|jgi:protein TonB|nr:energy transducer TonB [Prevotella sp.]
MSQIDLIDNRWSDLMFENRNKEYGAYVLRRQTTSRNIKSIIAVLILFAIVMVYMVAKNAYDDYQKAHMAQTQVTELTALQEQKKEAKVERKEIVKQEKVEQVVEKVKSSIKFTAPVIKKDDEVRPEDEMKSQDEIMNSKVAVGFANVIGNDESGEVLKAKEMIINEPVKPKEEENKVFDVVEQMPSFPGGMAALMAYLQKSIKYPPVAEENGIQGRVVCTFVVERDGSVTDVKVAKSVDPSLDKEAVRVVSAMPKWIPGKQNGQSVRVKYTLPVTFRLQ